MYHIKGGSGKISDLPDPILNRWTNDVPEN